MKKTSISLVAAVFAFALISASTPASTYAAKKSKAEMIRERRAKSKAEKSPKGEAAARSPKTTNLLQATRDTSGAYTMNHYSTMWSVDTPGKPWPVVYKFKSKTGSVCEINKPMKNMAFIKFNKPGICKVECKADYDVERKWKTNCAFNFIKMKEVCTEHSARDTFKIEAYQEFKITCPYTCQEWHSGLGRCVGAPQKC